jgi:hypothetical protein
VFQSVQIRVRRNRTSVQRTRVPVRVNTLTLIWVRRDRLGRLAGWGQALNSLQPVYRPRCSVPAAPTSPSAPDRPWQKRYSAPGPVSAAITCLGIAVAAFPTASVQGRYLMRRMRISTFEPIPNPITFRQHHVMERFFPSACPCARRHVCLSGFCQLGLRAAGYALLSAVLVMRLARFCTRWPSFFSLFY